MLSERVEDYLIQRGEPKFRSSQFKKALFQNAITSFDEITNFPKELREDLKSKFDLSSIILVQSHIHEDTIKFLFKTKDSHFIEAVLMLHNDSRRTLCLSSQVFCALACTFCATGANQFRRNLSSEEMIDQALFVQRHLKHRNERITNVVFMGMGEPFLNYDELIKTIKILNNPDCFGIGARHITVSTSGIVPRIYDLANLGIQVRLAISLHAPNDKLRTELMPINKRYPLSKLMEAIDEFSKKTGKRVSYEYVLIKNVNDSIKEAEELSKLLKNRLAHVNLLIYNPHEFAKYERPEYERVRNFRDILKANKIEVSIRKSMGDDISGACGQLSGKEIKKEKK